MGMRVGQTDCRYLFVFYLIGRGHVELLGLYC